MPRCHTVYRVYDAADALLYVGVSHTAIIRLTQHSKTQTWFRTAARAEFEHFESRVAADASEREYIRTLRPRHNVVGIGSVKPLATTNALGKVIWRYQSYNPESGFFDHPRSLRAYATLIGVNVSTLSILLNEIQEEPSTATLQALARTFPAAASEIANALAAPERETERVA